MPVLGLDPFPRQSRHSRIGCSCVSRTGHCPIRHCILFYICSAPWLVCFLAANLNLSSSPSSLALHSVTLHHHDPHWGLSPQSRQVHWYKFKCLHRQSWVVFVWKREALVDRIRIGNVAARLPVRLGITVILLWQGPDPDAMVLLLSAGVDPGHNLALSRAARPSLVTRW